MRCCARNFGWRQFERSDQKTRIEFFARVVLISTEGRNRKKSDQPQALAPLFIKCYDAASVMTRRVNQTTDPGLFRRPLTLLIHDGIHGTCLSRTSLQGESVNKKVALS